MKSIKTKIVALLLCCVLLSTGAVGALSLWKMTDVFCDYAEGSLQLSCKKTAGKVNDGMEAAEKIAARLARHVEGLLESPEILSDARGRDEYAEKVAKDGFEEARPMSEILGIYLNLYPDDEKTVEYNWLRIGMGSSFYAVNQAEAILETDKKETMQFVRTISCGGTPLWTGKYMSERLGIYLFSYAMPLLSQGHVIGTVGVEIPWDTLLSEMNKSHEYASEKAFLFDKHGNILYTPLVENSEGISQEILAGLVFRKTEGNEVLSYEKNGQEGKAVYAELRNGMYLCVSAADSEIYKGQKELLLRMGQIFLMILICTLLIALVLANHMTRPLKKLEYATRKMSQGDFNVALTAETEDEVGELTETFIKARQKLKEQMEDLETEAFHDELTGVRNKSALSEFEEVLNQKIESGKARFEVAVLDVNMLKITNDTQGHAAGDMLLKTVAGKLIDLFGTDRVFRIGGDEFLVISEEETDLKEKLKMGLKELEESTAKESGMHAVTCAFGTAVFDKKLDTCFADAMERADGEMYKDKNHFQRRNALWRTDSAGARRIQIEKYAEFLRILSQSTEDYLFLMDIQTNTNWFFGAISEKYPLAMDESGANSIEDMLAITHQGDREMLRLDLDKIAEGKIQEHHKEYRWINKEGETTWINCRGRVIKDENGKPFVMIGRVSDSNMRLFYNPLTGLFNKEKFKQNMQENLLESYNYMMLLHVDGMREYNLKYGRQYGDEILKELAAVLENKFTTSSVYHMEQDRFALLLSASESDAVESIFAEIQAEFKGHFTVSAAVVPNDKSMYVHKDDMYDFAKQLLKGNRDKGDRTIVFFSEEELSKINTSACLLKELENSVENHCEGFYLCYQPQMNANSLSSVGAEALLRYRSESKEAVYPDVFIPILERTGLIHTVGMYVLDAALGMCKKWRETIPDFRMSVNISVVQLRHEDLLYKILACLEKHGLPGEALTVEITESVQLDETKKWAGFFEGLHAAGVRISIDDFGSGYANFGYLRKIHANEIKIDRMFICDVEKNSYNYDVISNTIAFSHANGIDVCLEGVERVEELAAIESLRPETLQGYLFAKPMEQAAFEAGYILRETEAYKERTALIEVLQKQRANINIKETVSQENA